MYLSLKLKNFILMDIINNNHIKNRNIYDIIEKIHSNIQFICIYCPWLIRLMLGSSENRIKNSVILSKVDLPK